MVRHGQGAKAEKDRQSVQEYSDACATGGHLCGTFRTLAIAVDNIDGRVNSNSQDQRQDNDVGRVETDAHQPHAADHQ